jgi:hypothetical protein
MSRRLEKVILPFTLLTIPNFPFSYKCSIYVLLIPAEAVIIITGIIPLKLLINPY